MLSKQQAVASSKISSVLFMNKNGEPMSFFLRPGPVKRKLQPLIKSGGGMLHNVQQPGTILLTDPDEKDSIPKTTAHWYVSTKYIHDCIEMDQHLKIEDYRLNPEVVPRPSAKCNNSTSGLLGGRVAYTPEEDAAILSYVSNHKGETGGNWLWQKMEKLCVTNQSWQSMKYRYRVQLSEIPCEAEEGKTDEESRVEINQEMDTSTENVAPPQAHAPETDAQLLPAESVQPENVRAETMNIAQPGEPCLDPQAEAGPIPAESTARQRLKLEALPLPGSYGKELRSTPTSSSSRRRATKYKLALKPGLYKYTTVDPPPPKRARRKIVVAMVQSQQVESVGATVMEPPQPDDDSHSASQNGEKKGEKRKLGILELAAMELGYDSDDSDYSDSSDDGPPSPQIPREIMAIQPTSTEPPLLPSGPTADQVTTQANPKPAPRLQEESESNPQPAPFAEH